MLFHIDFIIIIIIIIHSIAILDYLIVFIYRYRVCGGGGQQRLFFFDVLW